MNKEKDNITFGWYWGGSCPYCGFTDSHGEFCPCVGDWEYEKEKLKEKGKI